MASMLIRRLSPESLTLSRVSPAWSCEARFQPESVLKLWWAVAEVAGFIRQYDAGDLMEAEVSNDQGFSQQF